MSSAARAGEAAVPTAAERGAAQPAKPRAPPTSRTYSDSSQRLLGRIRDFCKERFPGTRCFLALQSPFSHNGIKSYGCNLGTATATQLVDQFVEACADARGAVLVSQLAGELSSAPPGFKDYLLKALRLGEVEGIFSRTQVQLFLDVLKRPITDSALPRGPLPFQDCHAAAAAAAAATCRHHHQQLLLGRLRHPSGALLRPVTCCSRRCCAPGAAAPRSTPLPTVMFVPICLPSAATLPGLSAFGDVRKRGGRGTGTTGGGSVVDGGEEEEWEDTPGGADEEDGEPEVLSPSAAAGGFNSSGFVRGGEV